jgi:hypothetical protein
MEIDMKDMSVEEGGDGVTEIEMSDDEDEVDQFRMVPIRKGKVTFAARSSKRESVGGSSKTMEKAMDKKGREFQDPGMTSSYSIFNSFEPLHFDELSVACGGLDW